MKSEKFNAKYDEKDLLMANFSHELRTPLNAIIGFSELLFSEEKKNENRQMLEMISSSGKYLLDLVNAILDLSCYKFNKIKIESKKVNFNLLVNEVISLLREKILKKGLKISYFVSEKLSSKQFMSDAVKIKQIIINLMDNAIKYTSSGFIYLSIDLIDGSDEKKEMVSIKVSDTGIGIAPDKLPYIFNPFFQADNSLSKNYSGLGLGLSIVRRIADCLGADIRVESVENQGSVFELRLASTKKVSTEKASTEVKGGDSDVLTEINKFMHDDNKYKLLLVEADKTAQWLINKIAEKYRICEVRTADSFGEAKKIIKSEKIDMILIDDGEYEQNFEEFDLLIKNLNSNGKNDIKKIIFTCCDCEETINLMLDTFSFDDFLPKPLDVNKFINLLKKYKINREGTVFLPAAA